MMDLLKRKKAPLTDEAWQPVADGMLLRIDRRPMPRWRIVL